ncbi:hypothetical protein DIE22_33625 [Burkholderia sp. Bp9142]|nr:hypothetical protein DIE22_33625 [Burkholderia sp. Bp9142]
MNEGGKRTEYPLLVRAVTGVGISLDASAPDPGPVAPHTARSTPVRRYPNRATAVTGVFDYIEMFYNPIRRHGSADDLSPVELSGATR